MELLISSLGLIGSIIIVSAYWPQISTLVKLKKSDEFNLFTWIFWLLGNVLLLAYVISTKDMVYIVLEGVSVFSLLLICLLIINHKIQSIIAVRSSLS